MAVGYNDKLVNKAKAWFSVLFERRMLQIFCKTGRLAKWRSWFSEQEVNNDSNLYSPTQEKQGRN